MPICRERDGYKTRKGKKSARVLTGFQLPVLALLAGRP